MLHQAKFRNPPPPPPAPPRCRPVRGDIRPTIPSDGSVNYQQGNPWKLLAVAGWLSWIIALLIIVEIK